MVDFQPRPFKKFHEKCKNEEAKQIEKSSKAISGKKNRKLKWQKRYILIERNLRQVMALF